MVSLLRVALIQMNSGRDKQENLHKAEHMAKQAANEGARLIVLPEVFNYRGTGLNRDNSQEICEAIPGPSLEPFMALAKQHQLVLLAGSIFEPSDHDYKAYNTSVCIGAEGQILAQYRKQNLFEACVDGQLVRESNSFVAGTEMVSAQFGPWTMALSICFDLRFPELYQAYRKAGANILAVPSSFTAVTGEAHWEPLLRARAIENFCYVLAANQVGNDGHGIASFGHSMVIDPWGEVLVRGSLQDEQVLYATLDHDHLRAIRQRLSL